jgi:hypothetical protein
MEIVLSNEQTIINKALELFVLQGNGNIDHEIILIGYAGTGKTTLITKFLGDMLYDKKCKRIAIAAPTHKAVNIIKNKLFNNFKNKDVINKYIEITTIQRLLNYKNYINSNGERYFSMGSSEPLWSIYDIIIIDECSMLSDQIIDDIQSIIKKPKNKNVKVIYVGDPAQLPPVNQQSSKIFKENIKKLYLEKIIRTNCNDIIEISRSQRKWITTCNDEFMPQLEDNDNVTLFHNTETNKWLEHFIKNYEGNGGNGGYGCNSSNNSVILTWTNKSCNKYNEYIRKKIFNKNILNRYEPGELLIFNDYYKKSIGDTSINFYTSEQIKLYKIKEDIHIFDKLKSIRVNFDKCCYSEEMNKIILPLQVVCNNIINKTIDKLNKLLETPIKVFILDVKKINNGASNDAIDICKKYSKKIKKIIKNILNRNIIDDTDLLNKDFSNIDNYIIEQMKIIDLYKEDIRNNQKLLLLEHTGTNNGGGNAIDSISNDIEIVSITTINDNNRYDNILKDAYELLSAVKEQVYKEIEKISFKSEGNMSKCDLILEIENKINKLWKSWNKNVVDVFAHLNYGYCITVHKSQGSTFKNSYIDVNDILSNNNKEESLKCLYTAITRASNHIILHI